jgi:hypothetical protein
MVVQTFLNLRQKYIHTHIYSTKYTNKQESFAFVKRSTCKKEQSFGSEPVARQNPVPARSQFKDSISGHISPNSAT